MSKTGSSRLLRRNLVAALLLAAFGLTGYALAGPVTVELGPSGPQPSVVTVNWGDTVTFVNKDSAQHVVASRAGGFTSPTLNPGDAYTHVFDAKARKFAYDQTLGRKFRGTVDVRVNGTLTLVAGRHTVIYGHPIHLSGSSPYGQSPVVIQQQVSRQWKTAANLTPATDGTFATDLTAVIGSKYRAAAAADQLHSAQLNVKVTPAMTVRTSRNASRLTVRVTVKPGDAAVFATLLRYNAKRFKWQTVATKGIVRGVAVLGWNITPGRSRLRVSIPGRSTKRGFTPVLGKPFTVG